MNTEQDAQEPGFEGQPQVPAYIQFVVAAADHIAKCRVKEATRLLILSNLVCGITLIVIALGLRSANQRIEALENAAAIAAVKHEAP